MKDLTLAQQKLSGLNIRSTLLMAATMIGLFWGLNSYYSGVVVAKLPFEPISIVRSLAHRNLSGDDVTVSAMPSRRSQQCFLGAVFHKDLRPRRVSILFVFHVMLPWTDSLLWLQRS